MTPVKSSQIAAIGYDGNSILTVQFTRGGTYQYHDVSPEKYANLMSAESIGSYFAKNIKGEHKFTKVDPE